MTHTFIVRIATEYGMAEAVILNNLWFWVKKNEANEVNFHDGEYWTFNSIKAFERLFPYLSNKQIRTTLKHLIDAELIKIGSFNKSAYDRTTWYSFTEKGVALMETSSCPTGQMELPTEVNGLTQEGEPIPDNKHISKNTDGKTHIYSAEFENLWELYPRKQGKKDALKKYIKVRTEGTSYEEVEQGIRAYVEYIVANRKEGFIKMGSSFFNQEAWQDDWSYREEQNNGNKKSNGTVFGADGTGKGQANTRDRDIPPQGFRFPDAPRVDYDETP